MDSKNSKCEKEVARYLEIRTKVLLEKKKIEIKHKMERAEKYFEKIAEIRRIINIMKAYDDEYEIEPGLIREFKEAQLEYSDILLDPPPSKHICNLYKESQ